jgi:hypothetical protein
MASRRCCGCQRRQLCKLLLRQLLLLPTLPLLLGCCR